MTKFLDKRWQEHLVWRISHDATACHLHNRQEILKPEHYVLPRKALRLVRSAILYHI
jgi:hypothetical protein